MKKLFTLIFIMYAGIAQSQLCIPNSSSLQFNGTSTYISFPASSALDITDSISIEAWINSDSWGPTPAANSIVCKHGWSAGEAGYVLRAGGTGELSFNIGADSLGVNVSWKELVSSAGALLLNTWYHVAGTFDGSNLKIYINGVLAGTRVLGFQYSIVPSPTYQMKIGRLSDSVQFETRYWSGMIDEVRVWHRVLSQSEIAANMNHHIIPANATDLVGYWRFNDATGTTVADSGTGNNTGIVLNGTWSANVPFNDGPAMPVITAGGPYLYSSTEPNYQWNLNGVPIPNATFLSYVPTVNGSYTVSVTDSNGCTATSVPFIVTTINFIENLPDQLMRVQNLSNRTLRFISSQEIIDKAEIKLFDISGRPVVVKEKGITKNEIDVSALSAGVYMLYVLYDNKEYKTKIVLMR